MIPTEGRRGQEELAAWILRATGLGESFNADARARQSYRLWQASVHESQRTRRVWHTRVEGAGISDSDLET